MDKNPDKISFSASASDADKKRANDFAAVLYAVMNSFSTIKSTPQDPGDYRNGKFDSLLFMANIIGGNVAVIPNLGAPGTDPVASASGIEVRDQSKSLERGVANFNAVPSYDWYANPAVPAGNVLTGGTSTFNAYSLDPFVWFVHEYLGASAYAFSLDDDAANPTVAGAQTMAVSIGGITPFPNKAEWSPGTQFGPVPTTATFLDQKTHMPVVITTKTVKGILNKGMSEITNLTPDAFPYLTSILKGATNGALVIGPGINLAPNDLQAVTRLGGDVDNIVNPGAQTVNLIGGDLMDASGDYVFFGPVHVTGTIDSTTAPNKITGLNADDMLVLKTIISDPTFAKELLVSGPGVQPNTTIQEIGDNSITLDPAHPLKANFKGVFRFRII
jgi:hypothetical protein